MRFGIKVSRRMETRWKMWDADFRASASISSQLRERNDEKDRESKNAAMWMFQIGEYFANWEFVEYSKYFWWLPKWFIRIRKHWHFFFIMISNFRTEFPEIIFFFHQIFPLGQTSDGGFTQRCNSQISSKLVVVQRIRNKRPNVNYLLAIWFRYLVVAKHTISKIIGKNRVAKDEVLLLVRTI